MITPDHLDVDRWSAPGGEPVLLVDAARWTRPGVPVQAVVIGIDREGVLPPVEADYFDLLVTTVGSPPPPWVQIRNAALAGHLVNAVRENPLAATTAAHVLRLTEKLAFDDAVTVESLAYSALLGGSEFARWLGPVGEEPDYPRHADPVRVARDENQLVLTLNHPDNRNAMSAAMRDALYEALANALDDPTRPDVLLRGAGRCFSTGGDLAEFGSAQDLAEAHAVRTLHSCARALNALGPRATVRLHGACVGSGIEVAAAAHRRIAAPDAWFSCPNLAWA